MASNLYNCIKSKLAPVGEMESNEGVIVTPQEVFDAVFKLKNNKSCGLDKVTSEHLKFASRKLYPLLAMCFTGFMMHGVLPESLLSVLLVPVVEESHLWSFPV